LARVQTREAKDKTRVPGPCTVVWVSVSVPCPSGFGAKRETPDLGKQFGGCAALSARDAYERLSAASPGLQSVKGSEPEPAILALDAV